MANAKLGLVDAQEAALAQDEKIKNLKRQFEIREATVEVDGFKYKLKDGKPFGHAFCPRCEAVDGRMILLVDTHKAGRPDTCPQCKTDYIVREYR